MAPLNCEGLQAIFKRFARNGCLMAGHFIMVITQTHTVEMTPLATGHHGVHPAAQMVRSLHTQSLCLIGVFTAASTWVPVSVMITETQFLNDLNQEHKKRRMGHRRKNSIVSRLLCPGQDFGERLHAKDPSLRVHAEVARGLVPGARAFGSMG